MVQSIGIYKTSRQELVTSRARLANHDKALGCDEEHDNKFLQPIKNDHVEKAEQSREPPDLNPGTSNKESRPRRTSD